MGGGGGVIHVSIYIYIHTYMHACIRCGCGLVVGFRTLGL